MRARMDADNSATAALLEHSGACREQGAASRVEGWQRGFRACGHRGSMS
jgi:hypothetical protein